MKPTGWLDLSWQRQAWRPRAMRRVMQDLAGVARQPEHSHRTHLRATLEWLCRAQDASRAAAPGSVAAGWDFESGWQPASLEVSACLIETCVPAADYLAWPELVERARAMLDGLLVQPDTGSAARIRGLLAGHVQLGDAGSLERALAAARLLGDATPRSAAAHAQAAHILSRAGVLAQDRGLREAARRHLDAALAQQTPCGWFSDQAGPATTAVLAAGIRGLVESASLLEDARGVRAAVRAAQAICDHLGANGSLVGAFDDGWMPAATHVCVLGAAQMAACWLRLAQLGEGAHWRDAAWRTLAWIKRNQRTEGDDPAVRDALPSAVPIWSGPAAFRFDTLAAKYFADALMMDMVGIAIPPDARKADA